MKKTLYGLILALFASHSMHAMGNSFLAQKCTTKTDQKIQKQSKPTKRLDIRNNPLAAYLFGIGIGISVGIVLGHTWTRCYDFSSYGKNSIHRRAHTTGFDMGFERGWEYGITNAQFLGQLSENAQAFRTFLDRGGEQMIRRACGGCTAGTDHFTGYSATLGGS